MIPEASDVCHDHVLISETSAEGKRHTPYLPTKIIPTKTFWLKVSGNFPKDLRIPPLKIKILLESNPLKSRILVRRLAACHA